MSADADGATHEVKRLAVQLAAFARALHEASARGALVPCGEALCAPVGASPRRVGRGGEYLVVE
jgi:hypothetical protein